MKLFSSLDSKDRNMMLVILGLIAALFVVLAFLTPPQDPNSNTVPDSNLAAHHGAKAAFTLLAQSGYAIQRSEVPLSTVASQAGPGTVVILAEPTYSDSDDHKAVAEILRKGGRVLATGFRGGDLLPGNSVTSSKAVSELSFAACEAQPDGLGSLAGTGSIWIVPEATWEESSPQVRTAYTCAGQPVVVEYPVGKGLAVWWASSTPLENSSITRGQNLELLLNSVGPPHGQKIDWDESLHNEKETPSGDSGGPVWSLLGLGSIGMILLVIFSLSRRSGPVRPMPHAPRTTPIEFLDALGGLYRSTGAASTAMQIAWERFRSQAGLLTGQPKGFGRGQSKSETSAKELSAAITRRFGAVANGMEPDLIAAEEACWDDKLKPRRALALVQALRRHEETLRAASSRGQSQSAAAPITRLAS
jgi:hypothetical protein